MIRTLLLALLLAIGASAAAAAVPELDVPTPYLIDNNIIAKIVCGKMMGSGVYLGGGRIATARHLVVNGNCTVSGLAAKVVPGSIKAGSDFALVTIEARATARALVDCGGFQEGELYLATGYAENAPQTVTQLLTGTSARTHERVFDGLAIFRGAVTQGMSGGPIVKLSNGALVGLISANSTDGVTQVLGLPLSDTMLCRKG